MQIFLQLFYKKVIYSRKTAFFEGFRQAKFYFTKRGNSIR